MNLEEMKKVLGEVEVFGKDGVDIKSIAYHTEHVRPDSCFVAIKGQVADGHRFVDDAVKRGASVVVTEKPVRLPEGVTNLVVSDTRDALARLSSAYFNEPSLGMRLVGITGTNGKTTITYLLESIFDAAGWTPGVIGTVDWRYPGSTKKATHTTPESYELQKLLREMTDANVDACAMEVSSHALTMERVVGCHFDGAIFTNLSPEHLDYHKDMESYFAGKRKLFTERLVASVKERVFAAVNVDDPYGRRLCASIKTPLWRYAIKEEADVRCRMMSFDANGMTLVVATPDGEAKVRSSLYGRFNVENILAAMAAGLALGVDLETVTAAVGAVKRIPGRMDPVPNPRDILAFVDYAHTPDALNNVLFHAKELAKSRLIVVFGCGGDRDQQKRPFMGEAVSKIADFAIVTSDNPRTENPGAIIDMIIPGLKKFGGNYEVIEDRRAAIERAVRVANPGDVILVAGKGHEDYQIVGTEKRHFDDREVLEEFLK